MSNGANKSKRSSRWLLAALGVVVLAFVGNWAFTRFVEQPRATNERLQEQLNDRINKAKLELKKSKLAVRQLESLEQKSLPWNAEMALEQYQDWLLSMAQDAKLEGTSVDSGRPVPVTKSGRRGTPPIELYKRFNFNMRGRGDLARVTHFLYEFYRAGHLHKIRSMGLNPVTNGQEVDLNLSIEAIALPNADRESELSTLVSDELVYDDLRDYQLISRRNFFGNGGAQTAWRQVQLSAVTSDTQGVGEAWFRVTDQKDTAMLQVGQSLLRPSFEVLVVALDDATATVDVDGRLYRLGIGQTLAEALPVKQ